MTCYLIKYSHSPPKVNNLNKKNTQKITIKAGIIPPKEPAKSSKKVPHFIYFGVPCELDCIHREARPQSMVFDPILAPTSGSGPGR
jgi:hypothetical protein